MGRLSFQRNRQLPGFTIEILSKTTTIHAPTDGQTLLRVPQLRSSIIQTVPVTNNNSHRNLLRWKNFPMDAEDMLGPHTV